MRKTLKKFLALFLATLMLVSMSVGVLPVSAEETATETVKGDYDYAVNYLSALGILKGYPDGKPHSEDPVQRYQAALFFVRILTGYTEEMDWEGKTKFTDVTSYGGAINFVENIGIVIGVGNNKFAPNDGIRYQDALVMAVRALGYETPVMSYPYGYTNKANALGLTKGITGVAYKDPINRGVTAQIMYNLLHTPIKEATTITVGDGGHLLIKDDKSTYLSINFNTESAYLPLVATDTVALNGSTVTSKEGYVKFGGSTAPVNSNIVKLGDFGNIDEALGLTFEVIYEKDTGKVLSAILSDVKAYENRGALAQFTPYYDKNGNVKEVNEDLLVIDGKTYEIGADEAKNDDIDQLRVYLADDFATHGTLASSLSVEDIFGVDFGRLTVSGVTHKNAVFNYGKLLLVDALPDEDGYEYALFYPYQFIQISDLKAVNEATGKVDTFKIARDLGANADYRFLGGEYSKVAEYFGLADDEALAKANVSTLIVDRDSYDRSLSEQEAARTLEVRGGYKSGNYVIGYYSSVFNYFDIVTTGTFASGRLTSYNATAVTIDKALYDFGYHGVLYGIESRVTDDYAIAPSIVVGETTLAPAVRDFVTNALASLATIGTGSPNVKYLVIDGRVVYLEKVVEVTPNEDYDFAIISAGFAENKADNGITLDANNNILVYAITEDGTYKQIKVSAIYDSSVGATTTDFVKFRNLKNANMIFNSTKLYMSRGEKAFYDYVGDREVRVGKFDNDFDVVDLFGAYGPLYVVMKQTNGTYVLDVNLAYAENYDAIVATQPVEGTVTFKNGVTTKFVNDTTLADYGINSDRVICHNETMIALVSASGAVAYNIGIPENGTFINLKAADYVLAATSELIVIYTASDLDEAAQYYGVRNAEGVVKYSTWKGADETLAVKKNVNAYVFIDGSTCGLSQFVGNADVENGTIAVFSHEFKNILNLKTGALENITLLTSATLHPMSGELGSVSIVEIDKNGLATVTEVGAMTSQEAAYAVAVALGYNFGTLTEIGDKYAIHIDGADNDIRDGVAVTNEDVACGANENVISGYSVLAVYYNKDAKVNAGLTIDASAGVPAKIFNDLSAANAYCAYKYDSKTNTVEVIVFVPAAVSQW